MRFTSWELQVDFRVQFNARQSSKPKLDNHSVTYIIQKVMEYQPDKSGIKMVCMSSWWIVIAQANFLSVWYCDVIRKQDN